MRPSLENVLNFVVWSENQTLFTTAKNRLSSSRLDNSPLFSETPDVQNDYEEAVVSLKSAEDQNVSAKNAFAQSLSPNETLFL